MFDDAKTGKRLCLLAIVKTCPWAQRPQLPAPTFQRWCPIKIRPMKRQFAFTYRLWIKHWCANTSQCACVHEPYLTFLNTYPGLDYAVTHVFVRLPFLQTLHYLLFLIPGSVVVKGPAVCVNIFFPLLTQRLATILFLTSYHGLSLSYILSWATARTPSSNWAS